MKPHASNNRTCGYGGVSLVVYLVCVVSSQHRHFQLLVIRVVLFVLEDSCEAGKCGLYMEISEHTFCS